MQHGQSLSPRSPRACDSVSCVLVRLLSSFVLTASVAACRQIVDFDDSEQAKAQPQLEADFGPSQPYLSGAECQDCLETSCHEQQSACDADDFCSAWFIDARASELPLVANQDLKLRLADANWDQDHGAASGADVHEKLTRCSQSFCAQACRLGRDFSCVGRFEWPTTFPEETSVRVRYMGTDQLVSTGGLTVTACYAETDCSRPAGQAVTDEDGTTTLAIMPHKASLALAPEFYGYLRVDSTSDFPTTVNLRSDPFLDGAYLRYFLSTRALQRSLASLTGVAFDERRGSIGVQVVDCTGSGAIGVSLDFWARSARGFTTCDSCDVLYPDQHGQPDPTFKELQFPGRSAAVGFALGSVAVAARDTASGKAIGFLRTAVFEAEHSYSVVLSPASGAESKTIPSALR
jgi:hypothetical protein